MADTTGKRVIWFDVLNVVACFGVVAMHFNGLVHTYSPTLSWVQALMVDCLFYWAVPIFFMLSGATLMDYRDRYDTSVFLLKRMKRTLIPFLAWSLIALVWKVSFGLMEPPQGLLSLVDYIFNTKIIDIYWFFIPLFMVYLSLPALSLLRGERRVISYLIGIAAIFNIVLPFLCSIVGIPWNSQASLPVLSGYLIYVLIGYYLRDEPLSRRARCVIYALGVCGVLVRFGHTVLASFGNGELVNLTWGYTNPPCFLESIAVFVFARQVDWGRVFKTDAAKHRLKAVAGCSFGIYLIHMIVFHFGIWLTGLNGGDYEWRIFGPFVAYGLCLVLVWSLQHVPGIRRLIP